MGKTSNVSCMLGNQRTHRMQDFCLEARAASLFKTNQDHLICVMFRVHWQAMSKNFVKIKPRPVKQHSSWRWILQNSGLSVWICCLSVLLRIQCCASGWTGTSGERPSLFYLFFIFFVLYLVIRSNEQGSFIFTYFWRIVSDVCTADGISPVCWVNILLHWARQM